MTRKCEWAQQGHSPQLLLTLFTEQFHADYTNIQVAQLFCIKSFVQISHAQK